MSKCLKSISHNRYHEKEDVVKKNMKKNSHILINIVIVFLFLVPIISALDNINVTRFMNEVIFQDIYAEEPLPNQEVRNKICGFDELNNEIGIQELCSEKYNELSIKDKDLVQDVIENADSILSDKSKNDEIKLIMHELLKSTLPKDAYGNEINLPKNYEEFLKEIQATTKRIRENCPGPGFSSAHFRYSILIKDIKGFQYKEEKFEFIGPCARESAGANEFVNVDQEQLRHKNLSQTDNITLEYNDMFFHISCHSFNCPQYYKVFEGKCEKGYPFYDIKDYAPKGSARLEEIKEMFDRRYYKIDCEARGKDYIKNSKNTVEKLEDGRTVEWSHSKKMNKKCEIFNKESKQGFLESIIGAIQGFFQNLFNKNNKELDCGFAFVNYTLYNGTNETLSLRYCCCSCLQKNLTENYWRIVKLGKAPKMWTDLQINNITEKPKLWLESFDLDKKCGGKITADGKVDGLIDKVFDIHFVFGFNKNFDYGGQAFFNKNSKSFYTLDYSTKPGDYFYKVYAVLKDDSVINLKEGEFKIEACKKETPEKISEPVCGDGILNQASEECDPPGKQSQCYEGEICNNNCLCESIAKEVVCGDGIRDVSELCDGTQFSEQCIESHQTYLEINPNLVLECYNNCRGCQSVPV